MSVFRKIGGVENILLKRNERRNTKPIYFAKLL
jgi:hypothetical protein